MSHRMTASVFIQKYDCQGSGLASAMSKAAAIYSILLSILPQFRNLYHIVL